MLDELQRRAYLDAMGVECLLPRRVLPGAKASVICEMPEEVSAALAALDSFDGGAADAGAFGKQGIGSQAQAASAAADILNLLDTPGTKPNAKTHGQSAAKPADVAKASPSRQQAAQEQAPCFSVAVIRSQGLLLVDEGIAGETDPRAYMQLAANLLFALGLPPANLAVDHFRWPMAGGRSHSIHQSERAARDALQAFLEKRILEHGIERILLMGATAHQYACDEAVVFGQWQDHRQLPVKWLATTGSIGLALRAGRAKSALWQELQPLLSALRAEE